MKTIIFNLIKSFLYFIRALKSIKPSRRFCYSNCNRATINILGTGPSLKENEDKIVNTNGDFFALNDFGITNLFYRIKPHYYVLVDPAYWETAEKCNSNDVILRDKLFNNFNNIDWNLNLFVPWSAYRSHYIHERIHNPNIKIMIFNYTNFFPTNTSFYKYILKKNWGVVPVGNVLGSALYLSINLGYKTIQIFGAEHSWTIDLRVNDKNQVCTIKRHFFDDDTTLVPWKKSNQEIFRMSEILRSLYQHFLGYEYIEWYAKELGVHIYNCTKDSFIDSFKRKTI